jgi:hypothetical protein
VTEKREGAGEFVEACGEATLKVLGENPESEQEIFVASQRGSGRNFAFWRRIYLYFNSAVINRIKPGVC